MSSPPPPPPDRPNGGWASFGRLLTFFGPFKLQLLVSASCAVAIAFVGMAVPRQVGQAMNHIDTGEFDKVPGDVQLLLAAAATAAVLGATRRVVAGTMSLGIEQTLRERIFSHLTGLGFRFFDRQQTGQLLSRVTSDVTSVRFFLGYGLTYAFMHVAKIVFIPLYLGFIDLQLSLLVYVSMPVLLWTSILFARRSHPVLREAQQKLALVTAHGEETIVGARVVRSFGQEEREVERFRSLTDDVVAWERRGLLVQSRFRPLYTTLPNIVLGLVVLLGAMRIDAGAMTIGSFTTFFMLVVMLTSPLRIIGSILSRAQRATASSERLWELLDADDHIPERAEPTPIPDSTDGLELCFDGVSFGYRDGRPVIDDVSLTIPAGSTVAIIGPTGCGKTTLASMVPRFYDPEHGSVRLGGVDLRDLGLRELRRSIGLVDQEPFLFSATIADNLRYGNEGATDDDLWRALDAAQASEFVRALERGIDTVVGERGLTLSGGQRQRLAIARALVVDPVILILDDATASVDSQVESRISGSLASPTQRRTTIIIAHRPSTIALADHIVVMDEGRIVDQGTHDELILRERRYQLVHEQRAARREFLLDDAERRRAVEASRGRLA